MVREVQRTLPELYSHMSIMETLGGPSYGRGMTHWGIPGYLAMAGKVGPLVARDNYGLVSPRDITAPNLTRACFTTAERNQVSLQFNQNITWNKAAITNFYLDNVNNAAIISDSATGNTITLQLAGASTNKTVSYVLAQYWNADTNNLIYGANGITALTFSSVPIEEPGPARTSPVQPRGYL